MHTTDWRVALIEDLGRVALRISWQRAHWDRALVWSQRIKQSSDKQESVVILVLADMVRENPSLSTVFVAQFTQAPQGHRPTTAFVLGTTPHVFRFEAVDPFANDGFDSSLCLRPAPRPCLVHRYIGHIDDGKNAETAHPASVLWPICHA